MRLDVIRRISRKELTLFFASPIGYLFLASFLAVTLFVFFWVEAFFARNIADVRPMFEWMPVLLIFLCAALTMRMWSEERRTGTIEFVATLPASTWEFVFGKFLACWSLLSVALLLTLPLPVTVAVLADLDWGPVFAGYVAALLLGGAYLAIGLFVSSRTDSQIVSLILTCFASGAFFLIGNPMLTDLVGGQWADLMRHLGSGSRFDAITRGVLDFRDLYFYMSLLLVFLALNVYALETQRWAKDGDRTRHRNWLLGTAALAANLLLANVWLQNVDSLRLDVTRGQQYSISDATRSYLRQLREPLLIRGYFSDKTHPYLAPLVPQLRDLLNEYAVAGGDNVRVEIVDPVTDPALEDEANSKYGIRPNPFQVADRYQSSLVNSYFDVLISYGDEYEVLTFRDLIEVKVVGETELDVQLRNPEFDLTRSVKKVIYGFQAGDSLFANISEPVSFIGYVSADTELPQALIEYKAVLEAALEEVIAESDGKFSAEMLDPLAGNGELALEIAESYGFQPMSASLLDTSTFYFYLTLTDGQTVVQIPVQEALTQEAAKRGLEEGLKRFASGVLKTVALMAPERSPYMGMGQPPSGNQYVQLRDTLQADFNVQLTRLESGRVPETADMLMVIEPEALNEKQRFAIDQFLMQGGTVAIATSPFVATLSQQSLTATPRSSGLEEWLAHNGVSIGESFVMDPQNSAFPAPVRRQVGGYTFQELVMLDYPYFADIREEGIDQDSGIFAGIPQISMTWSSPLTVSAAEESGRQVTPLLRSSPGSWLSQNTDIMPQIDEQGLSTYLPTGETGSQLLAVMVEGRFESAFADQLSPLLSTPEAEGEIEDEAQEEDPDESGIGVISSVIDRSPESARLVVFASNSFLADQTLATIGSAEGVIYQNSVKMMANLTDWTLEDRSLLGIRARGQFNRTLPPLDPADQATIEYLNYLFALLGIALVFFVHRRRLQRSRALHRTWLEGAAA